MILLIEIVIIVIVIIVIVILVIVILVMLVIVLKIMCILILVCVKKCLISFLEVEVIITVQGNVNKEKLILTVKIIIHYK